jgi:hypothetical protein
LRPRTWQLVEAIFPKEADVIGRILVERCGQNLPFRTDRDEYELERCRFAALKISQGILAKFPKAVDMAKRDWRDEIMWAGFAESLTAHVEWAQEILGQE